MNPLRVKYTGILVNIGICISLAVMVWAVFGQTLQYDFVNYDDNAYIYDNPTVKNGLTLRGVAWAFTYAGIGHWHPLTWLSHMLDCQFYDSWAGGHHLTNVLLHAAAAVLLFLVLRQMTGALWRSAFVAAVFAIHPLHVESVAWVAERKDVLSGVFFMLTLGAYMRYARMPSSRARYAAVIALFALGLMCKGMLVTLPFVLLLLDYWPLCRWKPDVHDGTLRRLFMEKIPLFGLSAASCVITSLAPEEGAKMSFYARIANALVSCVIYLRQMVFPAGLAIPYPYPAKGWPGLEVALALVFLMAVTIFALAFWKKHPYFIVGWLWYLGMLVPVSGIVQISYYSHADRYTYLPQIGLYLLLAWAVTDLSAGLPKRGPVLGCISATIIAVLMFCASIQTSYWRDSRTLWTHALEVNTGNAVAQYCLGMVLVNNGQVEEGVSLFRKALEINPDFAQAHYDLGFYFQQKGRVDDAINQYQKALQTMPDMLDARLNLGIAFRQKGMVSEAIAQCQKAIEINPGSAKARNNLALDLVQNGEVKEAITQYQKALEIDPGFAEAYSNLGTALQQNGRMNEAIAHFQKALEINPLFAEARYNLGCAFQQSGQPGPAIAQYQKTLEIQPGLAPAMNNLAYLLAACPRESLRDGTKAVELARHASQATGGNDPMMLGTLAAAYAETGHFHEAVDVAQKALDLLDSGNAALADSLRAQIALYKENKPFRDENLVK